LKIEKPPQECADTVPPSRISQRKGDGSYLL
jgi:hypothetical protein